MAAALCAAADNGRAQSRGYDQLLALFKEWRAFEEPPRVNGAPDYSPATNKRRLAELSRMQGRLKAIDVAGWPIAQQVDHHLVRAEMNGMEYHLRVLQPFTRDPAYYASIITAESDTPSKEGPVIHGAFKLYDYPVWPRTVLDTVQPLSVSQAADLADKLRTIPPLLQRARGNLASANAKDLWLGGVRAFQEQSEALRTLSERVGSLALRAQGSYRDSSGGDRGVYVVARGAGTGEDRTFGYRQGPIHVVPAQRAPRAALVGRGGDDPAS